MHDQKEWRGDPARLGGVNQSGRQSGGQTPASSGDRTPDMIQSLTYAELAEALRITPESANRLARRKRWPRMKGNDGKARASVPEEALIRRDGPPDSPPDVPTASPRTTLSKPWKLTLRP